MSTVTEALQGLDEHLAREREKLERLYEGKRRILKVLPGDLPEPVISNEDSDFFGRPGAWLSWRYSGTNGSTILHALEVRGFEPFPATLCKWDNYWPQAEPGTVESIPDQHESGYRLTRRWPIAPVWIKVWKHGRPEACAYYMFRRDGLEYIFKATVPAPCTIQVDMGRAEDKVRLYYPETWHTISLEGQPVAKFSVRSFVTKSLATVGTLYWEPHTSQEAFPLSPAQFLAALEEESREAKQYAVKHQYSEVF